MPSSPSGICRDCNSRAVANGYCATHQTDNSKSQTKTLYDRYRADDKVRKLYRCKRWQGVRRTVLNRDILCCMCGHKTATDVDHILSARLVIDNFGVNEFYNSARLQGLCHECHSTKTAMECGWTGNKGTKLDQLTDRRNTTVVCGASGSGKSYYVEHHKQPDDPTFDYDVAMAELTGLPMHQALPGAIGSVLAQRDQFIAATTYCPHHVWLIVTNPRAEIVKLLEAAGANVVVLNTPDDVCQERLRKRFVTENI